jgi:hypothetical protein
MLFMSHEHSSSLIDALGGTCAVARVCEVSSQAVSKWRRGGIPRPWIKYFRSIRPDLFDDAGGISSRSAACAENQQEVA